MFSAVPLSACNLLAEVRVERRFELGNLPQNWMAVLALAVLGGVGWWIVRTYRAEARQGSTMPARMFLAGLRCAVVLLLALIWMEPGLATYLHEYFESHTLVLVDDSASLRIRDDYALDDERQIVERFLDELGGDRSPAGRQARSDLVGLIFSGGEGAFLRQLTGRNSVRLYAFSDRTVELAALAARRGERADAPPAPDGDDLKAPPLDLRFTGSTTNLGQTLRKAVDDVEGAPVAAVVVISDGAFNEGESTEVLGRFGRMRNIPIHTLGVGSPTPPRNLDVTELHATPNAFVQDPFEISARVGVQGIDPQTITVELHSRPIDGSGQPALVGRKQFVSREGQSAYPMSFEHRSARPGRYLYEMRVASGVDESITEDNRRQITVNVLDNKLRVLVVSSSPTWTYRYLSRLLERDETFDVSCWLQSAERTAVRDGNTVIDHLPETAGELFEYDLVVLLDPDAGPFPTGWSELVDEHVSRHGAGLMFSAGRKYTAELFRDPSVAPLVRLLPVVTDPEAELILNEIGYYQRAAAAIQLPQRGWEHPIFSGLAGAEAADAVPELWPLAGKVYWHYPVKHEKPAATVLMRHAHPRMRNSFGGHVLLAVQFVGAGRCAFLGFDGTWRWRRFGEHFFNRFWIQSLRYLAEGRLIGVQPRGRIQTDRDLYEVGQPIRFQARLTDVEYEPLTEQSVTLQLGGGGDPGPVRSVTLQRDPQRGGWYGGQLTPRQPGTLLASIRLPGGPQGAETLITHQVRVRRSNREILEPRLDRRRLQALARASAGGEYYNIDRLLELAERIPDRHETRITRSPPEPVWDRGWMLAALVGLLGVEWALRKRWQML